MALPPRGLLGAAPLRQLHAAAGEDFRVITFDKRGTGLSERSVGHSGLRDDDGRRARRPRRGRLAEADPLGRWSRRRWVVRSLRRLVSRAGPGLRAGRRACARSIATADYPWGQSLRRHHRGRRLHRAGVGRRAAAGRSSWSSSGWPLTCQRRCGQTLDREVLSLRRHAQRRHGVPRVVPGHRRSRRRCRASMYPTLISSAATGRSRGRRASDHLTIHRLVHSRRDLRRCRAATTSRHAWRPGRAPRADPCVRRLRPTGGAGARPRARHGAVHRRRRLDRQGLRSGRRRWQELLEKHHGPCAPCSPATAAPRSRPRATASSPPSTARRGR